MIFYNVTYKIEHRAHARFLEWMERIYLPQMLEDSAVDAYNLTQLESVDQTDGVTYCLLLEFTSRPAFDIYDEQQKAKYEQFLHTEFKGNYVSFPSTLKVVLSSRE